MSITGLVINLLVLGCLTLSFKKNPAKTKQALRIGWNAFLNIVPLVIIIIIFVGLLLGFVTSERITNIVGEQSGIGGVLLVGLLGSILFIPALVSFPLAASIYDMGASTGAVAAFIMTLTLVGTATLPVEIKELGKKFAFLRNGFSFAVAISVALIMGVIL
ncbi:MAG: permease [Dehalococcoidia bacterium]